MLTGYALTSCKCEGCGRVADLAITAERGAYDKAVTALESEGITRSDAQGIVDAEVQQAAREQPTAAGYRKGDSDMIAAIGTRAAMLLREAGRDPIDWMMDIEAAHQSVGLELRELFTADDGNFAHDVAGIARHLNRDTGELEDGFLPRFSAK